MRRSRSLPPPRRGAILLVVLSLLTLFAIVGISFVLYANAAAQSARLDRESASLTHPDVDPELLMAYFLGQLIYDAPDDGAGVYSAMRGHSLARNMYGANSGTPAAANSVPFNGVGRLRAPSPFAAVNDEQLINYTFYPDDPQLAPENRFLRDPERLGWRPADIAAPRKPYTGGVNAPYTYPDLNSMFLAAVRADGTVLLPSFHRPWTAIVPGSDLPPDAGEFYHRDTGELNDLWSATAEPPPWFKYTTLRPLPALNPKFPPPEDGGGDVKNLIGGPGTLRRIHPDNGLPEYWNNDSIWMDLNFPVLTAPDGRKYKPLFAALITDLDNRLNVNVHGNARGLGGQHVSNQGWGPWEVNLQRLAPPGDAGRQREWAKLLLGTAQPPQAGRYGPDQSPGLRGSLQPWLWRPHSYAQVDFDSCDEQAGNGPSSPVLLPGLGAPPYSSFPLFATGYGNGLPLERIQHPALANLVRPAGDDHVFAASNMEALLRYGDTGSPGLTSELFRLCPNNFRDPRMRGLVTTHTFDIDRPGAAPWIYNALGGLHGEPYDVADTTDADQPALGQGPPIPFPPLAGLATPLRDPRLNNGEFGGVDWRSVSAALGRVHLNRPLPPYPHQGSGTNPPFGPPLTRTPDGQVALDIPFNVDAATNGPIWTQFLLAQTARQRLANDIYRRLLVITGVPPILPSQNPQAPAPELLRSRRWLAQLAVNIVDFIDEDDISTPFCFYTAEDYEHLINPPLIPPDPSRVSRPDSLPGGPFRAGELQWPMYWVFGTELPRVVVNEALAEMKKTRPDDSYLDTIRVFVELHNPLPRQVSPSVQPQDQFPVPLRIGDYAPYKVVVGTKSLVRHASWEPITATIQPGPDNDNVLGNPEPAAVRTATTDLDFLRPMATIGGGTQPEWPGRLPYRAIPSPYVPAHDLIENPLASGYVLLGPEPARDPFLAARDPFAAPNNATIPSSTPVLRTPQLQFARIFMVRGPNDPPDERTAGVTVMLRRLANPYLPFNGVRTDATYNPFVTIDYLENIPVRPALSAGRPPVIASLGKLQPYAAHHSQLRFQKMRTPSNPNLRHTFGRANIPARPHYDWLTHLDRPLISPMELLHVSGYQPHQLTQRFMVQLINSEGQPEARRFGHRLPWFDEDLVRSPGSPAHASHRLYRLFEFVETGSPAAGTAAGGRLPGKINLNSVWDEEILQALADPQRANTFTPAHLSAIYQQMLRQRTPGLLTGGGPGPADRPFRSLATGLTSPDRNGQYPHGLSIEDTLLRSFGPGIPWRLLQPPSGPDGHPYAQYQLLTKIFNHLTTRSNVFAVWLTVGFFEVQDIDPDTGQPLRPARLGAEIGRAENRHIRHRMFAIVDRTNLSIASNVAALAWPVAPPPPAPVPILPLSIPVSALSGTIQRPITGPGIAWKIEAGSTLVVDTGRNQETVTVLAVSPENQTPAITAVFTRPHAVGAPIALANHPGEAPIFLKPTAVIGPAPLSGQMIVQIAVDPARSNATQLAGEYDGIPWTIRPGASLLLDVGPNQEAVTVEAVPFAINLTTGTGAFQVTVTRPHPPDVLITNTLLGNPGPQPRFAPGDPAFGAIVRYLSIIQ
jgi:hypothetical protein